MFDLFVYGKWLLAFLLSHCAGHSPLDHEFMVAQEEWVASISNGWPACPKALEALGSTDYDVRHETFLRLQRSDLRYFKDAVIASHSKDPNIRYLAVLLVNQVFRCPICHGDGICRECRFVGDPYYRCKSCRNWKHCHVCRGSGDLRFEFDAYSVDSQGNYTNTFRRRNHLATAPW